MKNIITLILLLILAVSPVFVFASETSGTIDTTYKYVWSDSAGWINLGCDNCNVVITDTAITGYAWIDNFGWISFSPSNCSSNSNCGVKNTEAGILSGQAWGENVGWIDFDGVTINTIGQFSGAIDSNSITGNILFSCVDDGNDRCIVRTDWRPISARSHPIPPSIVQSASLDNFNFIINSGNSKTNNLAVSLFFTGGQNISQLEISSDPNFVSSAPEAYELNKMFVLTQGDGLKTIYARFINSNGQRSSIISRSIILDTTSPEIKIDKYPKAFNPNENIVISGSINEKGQIIFSWSDNQGIVNVDNSGRWTVDFGKMMPGTYSINARATDEAGNSRSIIFNIAVNSYEVTEPIFPILPEILDPAFSGAKEFIQGITKRINSLLFDKNVEPLKMVVMVKQPYKVFKSNWTLIKVNPSKSVE